MAEQNFKNHGRIVFMFHVVAGLSILALVVGSIVNLFHTDASSHYSAALIVLTSLVLLILFWYTRAFALKAQDRAIRAEENFRHFIITGKPLDKSLRMSQIIALRFAPDEEFPGLAIKAIQENLSQKQIKQLVKNWRPDYHRA